MKQETIENLFKKGLITEETYQKGIQKFAGGGVVQQSPSTTTANPQFVNAPPGDTQQIKSPYPYISDQEWANTPDALKVASVRPDLSQSQGVSGIVEPIAKGLSSVGDFLKNKRESDAQAVSQITGKPTDQMVPASEQKPQAEQLGATKQQMPTQQQKPSPYQSIASDYDKAFQQMQTGIMQSQEAGAKQGAAVSSAYTTAINDLQKFNNSQQMIFQQKNNLLQEQALKMEQTVDEYKKASVIDPNRYWANKSTGDKVMAGIAVVLGNLGGGPNTVVKMIDNAIQRDIELQKMEADKVKGKYELQNNIYANMMKQFENETAAVTASRLSALNIAEMQIKKAEASTSGLKAKSSAQMALGELALKKNELQRQLLKEVQNSPSMLQMDDTLRKITTLPDNLRDNALKEFNEYSALNSANKTVNDIFNEMQNVTVVERMNPATKDQLKILKAKMIVPLKKIFPEALNEADVERMIDPFVFGVTDSEKTREKKREGFKSLITDQLAGKAPILTGMGIISAPDKFKFKENK